MYDKLKDEIYKEFDKSKNYNAILSKVKGVSGMKNVKVKIALGAVCVVAVALLGAKIIRDLDYTVSIDEPKWEIKEVYYDSSKTETTIDTAVVPHWDELTIDQQFHLLNYDGKQYDSRGTEIPTNNIGAKLGTATLTGTDEYTDEEHTINADIYDITNISNECAVAIQFDGTTEYYVYVNAYYKPKTLGDLVEDINLEDNISFGTVNYQYLDTDGSKEIIEVEFPDVKYEDIWNWLFDDLTLENVYTDNGKYVSDYFVKEVEISIDIPILGYKNISIRLTDKGYLITNILNTGNGFYIGEEKVQEFIDYLTENYKGYQIVYIDTNPNKDEAKSSEPKDDKIMVYDVATNTVNEVDMNSIRNKVDSVNGTINYTDAYNPTGK